MTILDKIDIVCADIRDVEADLLILKYADGLYGADLAVAGRIGVDIHVPEGQLQRYPGRNIPATQVAFIGVGDLFAFRYHQIRSFARKSLRLARAEFENARTVATTIHGLGYGLDEREAMLSQLQGYLDAADGALPERLLIVEVNEERAERLRAILHTRRASLVQDNISQIRDQMQKEATNTHQQMIDLMMDGVRTENPPDPDSKPKLFAAMPFAERYMDEYDIAFVDAAHDNGFICERLDREAYIGDVTHEIFRRIRAASGVIALLNENNPNVFLEVGYALALDKPVLLIARDTQEIAFDLADRNRLTYSRIATLRRDLTALIGQLKTDGTLAAALPA